MTVIGQELGQFLRSRRGRLVPPEPEALGQERSRRVAGLRREEVARLAGVSPDYYARLEQGRDTNFSKSVLEAVARALQLSSVDRAYLLDLARQREAPSRRYPPGPLPLNGSLQRMALSQPQNPAFIVDRRYNVLMANDLAVALFDNFGQPSHESRNFGTYIFFDKATQSLYDDWPLVARVTGGWLRRQLSRHPHDPDMLALVDVLKQEPSFHDLWMGYELDDSAHNRKLYHHPTAGDMVLDCDTVFPSDDTDQCLTVFTAPPGTDSEENLNRLRAQVGRPDRQDYAYGTSQTPVEPVSASSRPRERSG